jgi:uncharacterized protein (DUF2147 family)
MKIIVTTLVDRIWPVHRADVQTDNDVVIVTGESRNSPGSTDATVQQAAEDAIYKMEQQLKQAREHMQLNGLLKEKLRGR